MANSFSSTPLAGQTNTLQNAQNLFGGGFQDLLKLQKENKWTTDDVFNFAITNYLLNPEAQLDTQRKAAEHGYELNLRAAKEAQKLGKESLGYASIMDQIAKFPRTVASAFGNADERQIIENTYGNIPGIVSEAYRSFPRMQIQPVGFSAPSANYFS